MDELDFEEDNGDILKLEYEETVKHLKISKTHGADGIWNNKQKK